MTLTAPTEPVYALAFGAHPDDVELACGATLLKIMDEGQKVAVCDLTAGEMGTLGTAETRRQEAALATERMGYVAREQLDLGDSELFYSKENLRKIIRIIRKYRPDTVFCNPPDERHPDHMKASRLVCDACYYAGLRKIETQDGDLPQVAHRPRHLLYYIQFRQLEPQIVVDVSSTFERSRGGIEAFGTQFHRKENSDEPETMINRKEFLPGLEARARALGEQIGVMYGEGFLLPTSLGIGHFTNVFAPGV